MKTTVVDFNKGFVLPNGTSATEMGNQGAALSGQLAINSTGDPVKLWGWAVELSKTGILELDEADCNLLLKLIETSQNLTVLAKVQFMQTVKDARAKAAPCAGGS